MRKQKQALSVKKNRTVVKTPPSVTLRAPENDDQRALMEVFIEKENSVSISSIELKPTIHANPGSADRQIDVKPDQFPLRRYDPLRKVAQTEDFTLHVANDLVGGRTVLVTTGTRSHDNQAELFNRQAQSAARANHSALLPMLDHGITSGGRPYVVTEFIPGMTLRNYLSENAPIDDLILVNIFLEVCNAAHAAELQGVRLHDLSLDKILLATTIFGTTAVKINAYGVDFSVLESAESVLPQSKLDLLEIADCMQEAFNANQQARNKHAKTKLALHEEIEKVLKKAQSTQTGSIDTVTALKHELQALKELLTYSVPAPRSDQAAKPNELEKSKAILISLAVFLTFLSIILVRLTAPLPLAKLDSESMREKNLMEHVLWPLAGVEQNATWSEEQVLMGRGELTINRSDLTYAKLKSALTRQHHYEYELGPGPEAPVVDVSDDVFSKDKMELDPYSTTAIVNRRDDALSSIQALTIIESKIHDDTAAALSGQPFLELVTLNQCTGVTSRALSSFAKFETPRFQLALHDTDARGSALAGLRYIPNLYALDISDSEFSDSDLEYLVQLPIQQLTLRNTDKVTETGLEKLKRLRNLRGLHFYSDSKGSGSVERRLQTMFPTLVITTHPGDREFDIQNDD
jgi:hypothetical protein